MDHRCNKSVVAILSLGTKIPVRIVKIPKCNQRTTAWSTCDMSTREKPERIQKRITSTFDDTSKFIDSVREYTYSRNSQTENGCIGGGVISMLTEKRPAWPLSGFSLWVLTCDVTCYMFGVA